MYNFDILLTFTLISVPHIENDSVEPNLFKVHLPLLLQASRSPDKRAKAERNKILFPPL